MHIVVHDKQKLLSNHAVNKAKARANASFARFGFNIKSIEIKVQDVNGPRGGVDKACRVLVKLRKLKDVAVTVNDETLANAIPSAIFRAARSVGRVVNRRVVRDGGRGTKPSWRRQLVEHENLSF